MSVYTIYYVCVRLFLLPADYRLDGFRVFTLLFRRLAAAAHDDSPSSPVGTLCARVRRCTPRASNRWRCTRFMVRRCTRFSARRVTAVQRRRDACVSACMCLVRACGYHGVYRVLRRAYYTLRRCDGGLKSDRRAYGQLCLQFKISLKKIENANINDTHRTHSSPSESNTPMTSYLYASLSIPFRICFLNSPLLLHEAH